MPFLRHGPIGLFHEGKSYTLDPKEDITAYELYQIGEFKDSCNANKDPQAVPYLIDLMKELNIMRHFTEDSYVQG
jgi:hypothetical protein